MRLLTTALLALLSGAAPALADIQIGAAAPLSGQNAALGEQLRRGAQMAVDDFNANGGVRGQRIALTVVDDGCDPRKAVDAAQSFIAAGVKAVIGHYCSGASIPASKVYQKAGIVMISPASTNPKLTDEGGWNVVRMVPRDDAQGDAAAALVLDKFAGKTVAIVGDQSAGFSALAARFRAGLQRAGIRPIADESYKPGAKDLASLAGRVAAASPAVVYLAGSYVESGMIARALRDQGSRAQIVSGDALVTDDFWNQAGDAGNGALMTFTYDARKFPSAVAVVDRLRQQDLTADGFTLYAYAAVQAWAAAAEATGSFDGPPIAAWLRDGNRFDTAVGPVSFDAKGDLTAPRVAWFKWVDGRYVEIDPKTLAPPVLVTSP